MANQDKCHLLELPRELRDTIYEYTFTQHVRLHRKDIKKRNVGILLACKQTQSEASPLYYKCSVFQVEFACSAKRERKFTKAIRAMDPEHRNMIRTFLLVWDFRTEREILDDRKLSVSGENHRRPKQDIFMSWRERRAEVLRRFPKFEAVDKQVVKMAVVTWNGKENVEIWTSAPLDEEMPRFL